MSLIDAFPGRTLDYVFKQKSLINSQSTLAGRTDWKGRQDGRLPRIMQFQLAESQKAGNGLKNMDMTLGFCGSRKGAKDQASVDQ